MKIYDKEMFWGAIASFIFCVFIFWIYLSSAGKNAVNFPYYCIAIVITSSRRILTSLSEEKRREARLNQELSTIAGYTLFGGRSIIMGGIVLILILVGIAVANYNILLGAALLVLTVVYAFWYGNAIQKEVKRIKAEMETTED